MLVGVLVAAAGYWWWAGAVVVHDGAPSWSADGRQVVFAVEQDGQSDLYLMNADGSGRRALTSTTFDESAPAMSPDGKTIAYESNRDGNLDIYVVDSDGSHERRLTTDPAADRSPAWSPDGQSIAFTSERSARQQPDIYLMRADGSGAEALTHERTNWSPQFSRDGRQLAFQVDRDIQVMDLASHAVHPVTSTPDNGMSPTWSPDGTRLAFVTDRRGRLELFGAAADGSNQQVLASMAGGSILDPRWSPDGSRIAFVYVPDKDPGRRGVDQQYAIYAIDLASQKISRLSP